MHTTKKEYEQRKRYLALQSAPTDPNAADTPPPPPAKKPKSQLKREEAMERHKKEAEEQAKRIQQVQEFMEAQRDFIIQYDEENYIGVWESPEGQEALMKLASEISRMRNHMLKRLIDKSKGNAGDIGAPIENKVVASFTATAMKPEKKEKIIKNEELEGEEEEEEEEDEF